MGRISRHVKQLMNSLVNSPSLAPTSQSAEIHDKITANLCWVLLGLTIVKAVGCQEDPLFFTPFVQEDELSCWSGQEPLLVSTLHARTHMDTIRMRVREC